MAKDKEQLKETSDQSASKEGWSQPVDPKLEIPFQKSVDPSPKIGPIEKRGEKEKRE